MVKDRITAKWAWSGFRQWRQRRGLDGKGLWAPSTSAIQTPSWHIMPIVSKSDCAQKYFITGGTKKTTFGNKPIPFFSESKGVRCKTGSQAPCNLITALRNLVTIIQLVLHRHFCCRLIIGTLQIRWRWWWWQTEQWHHSSQTLWHCRRTADTAQIRNGPEELAYSPASLVSRSSTQI